MIWWFTKIYCQLKDGGQARQRPKISPQMTKEWHEEGRVGLWSIDDIQIKMTMRNLQVIFSLVASRGRRRSRRRTRYERRARLGPWGDEKEEEDMSRHSKWWVNNDDAPWCRSCQQCQNDDSLYSNMNAPVHNENILTDKLQDKKTYIVCRCTTAVVTTIKIG